MRKVFFHEDDFCQREVLPAANWEHVQAQFRHLKTFSEAHRAPGGLGWTDLYVRPTEPVPLATLGIPIEEIARSVGEHLPPFDRVVTGYSSHTEEATGVRAWGNDEGFVLFAGVGKSSLVETIWFEAWDLTAPEVERAVSALGCLPRAEDLFLADWGWEQALWLTAHEELRAYLLQRRSQDWV